MKKEIFFELEDLKKEIKLFFSGLSQKEKLKKYITDRYFEKYTNLDSMMFYTIVLKNDFLTAYINQMQFDLYLTKKETGVLLEIEFRELGNLKEEELPDGEEGETLKKRISEIQEKLLSNIKVALADTIKMTLVQINESFINKYKENNEIIDDLDKLDNVLLFEEYDFIYIPLKQNILYKLNERNKI